MVILVFFLAISLVTGLTMSLLARKDITGKFVREGPGRISEHLRRRNRVVIGGVLCVLVGIALLEIIIPEFHFLLLDLQYAIGAVLSADPIGVTEFLSGGGLSWGMYVSIFLATTVGVIIGTWTGCRSYPAMQGIGPAQLA